MAEKKKQHYVPKFYLRNFAQGADGKRISLCVVDGLQVVAEAGLDGQRYENYFYGADGVVEDQLQKMETDAAAIIGEVLRTGLPPASGSADAVELFCFVAAQAGRTKHAAAMMEAQTESFLKKIAVLSGRVTEEDLRGVRIEQKDAVLLPLITNIQSAVGQPDGLAVHHQRQPSGPIQPVLGRPQGLEPGRLGLPGSADLLSAVAQIRSHAI